MSSPAYKKVSPEDNFVAPMRGSTPSGTAGTAAAGVSSAAGVELVALRHRQGTDFARQHAPASRQLGDDAQDNTVSVVRCARRPWSNGTPGADPLNSSAVVLLIDTTMS